MMAIHTLVTGKQGHGSDTYISMRLITGHGGDIH